MGYSFVNLLEYLHIYGFSNSHMLLSILFLTLFKCAVSVFETLELVSVLFSLQCKFQELDDDLYIDEGAGLNYKILY